MAPKPKGNVKLIAESFKNKAEAVKAALAKVHKDHGPEAAMLFSDKPVKNIEKVSTGSMGLDIALGIGGYARGRIIEIYGLESSGKTTLSLHAIAEVQRAGGTAAFIDAEHALDPNYASNLGVDMDHVVISQPDNGEQALSIVETLVTSGGFDIIVVDSVAALVPQAEIDGEMGDHHVGTQARLMSQALRKLAGLVHKSNTILVFINQVRMKIGVMFGNPETTTGGNALKFYASQRLEVRRVGDVKDGEDKVGNRTKVKVVKNKLAPPFREVEFDIVFGKGVDYYGELVDIGSALGIVEKSGAWYSFAGERIGQGRVNAAEYLRAHEDASEMIDKQIRDHYRMNVTTTIVKEENDDTQVSDT